MANDWFCPALVVCSVLSSNHLTIQIALVCHFGNSHKMFLLCACRGRLAGDVSFYYTCWPRHSGRFYDHLDYGSSFDIYLLLMYFLGIYAPHGYDSVDDNFRMLGGIWLIKYASGYLYIYLFTVIL